MRFPRWILFGSVLLAAAMLFGFVLGAFTVQFQVWPYRHLAGLYRWMKPHTSKTGILRTAFIDLDIAAVDLQLEFEPGIAPAGGLAKFGNDVLLLQGNGRFHLLTPAELTSRRLDIEPPPNGAAALAAVPFEGTAPAYLVNGWHRYIDIEMFEGALYLSYSFFDGARKCFTSRLARLRLTKPLANTVVRASDWEIFFETGPCFGFKANREPYAGNQAGGRIAISADGILYLTVGDYQFDGYGIEDYPQSLSADYGKIWRIDLASGKATIFSLGHRNPQGIVVTPDGEIWETEHGPEGGDELNVLIAGENYGWPHVTYGTQYGERTWPLSSRQGRHDGFRRPAWAWVPSVAPASIIHVHEFHPDWDGNLILATLVAQSLYRIVTDGERVVTFEKIALGERVRDLVIQNGSLLVYTDSGKVLRLTPRAIERNESAGRLLASLSPQAEAALSRCLECHGRGRSEHAPDLCGVLGRPVGRSPYTGYSPALAGFSGRWDERLLMDFLRDADGTVPGTTMPDPAIQGVELRREMARSMAFFCG